MPKLKLEELELLLKQNKEQQESIEQTINNLRRDLAVLRTKRIKWEDQIKVLKCNIKLKPDTYYIRENNYSNRCKVIRIYRINKVISDLNVINYSSYTFEENDGREEFCYDSGVATKVDFLKYIAPEELRPKEISYEEAKERITKWVKMSA